MHARGIKDTTKAERVLSCLQSVITVDTWLNVADLGRRHTRNKHHRSDSSSGFHAQADCTELLHLLILPTIIVCDTVRHSMCSQVRGRVTGKALV